MNALKCPFGIDCRRKINCDDYDNTNLPTYPGCTLISHVAIKGVQLGSIVGLLGVTPCFSAVKKIPLSSAWLRIMPVTPAAGIAISMTMLYVKQQKTPMDEGGIDDRAYRIRNNIGQNTVDRYSVFGAATGAAVGAVVGNGFRSILAATSTGIALSVIFFAAEKKGLFGLFKLSL